MVPVLAGCDGPLSTLDPQGPIARDIALLWWFMLGGAAAITGLVLVLLVLAWRKTPDSAPPDAFWIKGLGLGFTMAVLACLVAAGIFVGERMQAVAQDPVFRVQATASQWHWRFTYDTPAGRTISSDGPLYIPAGQPVDVVLRSTDVIHAFWVPRLAGKMDAIPGYANVLRLQADQPGLYHGRSAEFSGTGYAGMRFEVIAFDPQNPPALLRPLTE